MSEDLENCVAGAQASQAAPRSSTASALSELLTLTNEVQETARVAYMFAPNSYTMASYSTALAAHNRVRAIAKATGEHP